MEQSSNSKKPINPFSEETQWRFILVAFLMCGLELLLLGGNLIRSNSNADVIFGCALIGLGCVITVAGLGVFIDSFHEQAVDTQGDGMSFTKLASVSEVPEGKIKAFNLSGKKIILVNAKGSYYAMANKCPHIGKPLENGTIDEYSLTCPYHKAKFNIRNGANEKGAELLFLKMACANAQTYPVKIDGEEVLVALD